MGQILISTVGSFKSLVRKNVSAEKHGHAAAVMEAIRFLRDEMLDKAIEQDVELEGQGHTPDEGFKFQEVTDFKDEIQEYKL